MPGRQQHQHQHQQQQQQQQHLMVPKGCVAVQVGADGEEKRKYAVPLGHLKHPLFGELLEEAEREYGFHQPGPIAIPCRVDRFVQVEHLIDQDLHGTCAQHLVDLDGGAAPHHHHHLHLPRFVGCFRA